MIRATSFPLEYNLKTILIQAVLLNHDNEQVVPALLGVQTAQQKLSLLAKPEENTAVCFDFEHVHPLLVGWYGTATIPEQFKTFKKYV